MKKFFFYFIRGFITICIVSYSFTEKEKKAIGNIFKGFKNRKKVKRKNKTKKQIEKKQEEIKKLEKKLHSFKNIKNKDGEK